MSEDLECTCEQRKDRAFLTMGLTINLGNYQTCKVDAGLSCDLLENESIEDAQARIEDKVMQYLSKRTPEIKKKVIDIINNN